MQPTLAVTGFYKIHKLFGGILIQKRGSSMWY